MNADTKHLSEVLRSASLTHNIQECTNKHGHILDLVITGDVGNLFKGVSVSTMLCDQFLIDILVSLEKPSLSAKAVSYRQMDKSAFKADLRDSSLVLDPPADLDQLVNLYDYTLRALVEKACATSKKNTVR